MLTCKCLISPAGRRVVLATIATLALVTPQTPVLAASPAPAAKDTSVAIASHDVTDFSSVRRRYYRRGGNAAGAAFMGMAMGLVAGAIAEQQRREYYENYGYYYGPRPYYAPRPYYYGPRYYYSPY
ncbi:MAG: hypothetical protein HY852_05995 [Bradyrhizobium sp.]|uniref:hypothetical protein n=1 Tax=Bradyrhizobium sp. TaxID=376 RepID=UPI0025C3E127|nr:hypothetical protein [Bradyrhizobium sp.]MBI5261355.1 hypothetical protein [Bradyrhizobium sp.]